MRAAALGGVALAALLAAALWAFEPVRVASPSMLPTLRTGDLVWVDKRAYGARDPERGEVVLLRREPDSGEGPQRFVKRVIGLPGERIDLVDEVVFVDGEPLARRRIGAFEDDAGRSFELLEVDLGGRSFRVLDDPALRTEGARIELGPGHYFLLGDHRDHSEDGRRWGPVDRDQLRGKVLGVE